jgi:hypothetical protein
MYDHFWELVVPFLQKLKIVISTPYIWDEKARSFVLIRNAKYVKMFKIVSCLIYVHMVIIAWNVFQVFKKESNILLQITSLGIAGTTMFATVSRWMHRKNAAAVVQLLNCMVAFQRSRTERGNNNKRFYTKTIYVPNSEIILVSNEVFESNLINSRAKELERHYVKFLNESSYTCCPYVCSYILYNRFAQSTYTTILRLFLLPDCK